MAQLLGNAIGYIDSACDWADAAQYQNALQHLQLSLEPFLEKILKLTTLIDKTTITSSESLFSECSKHLNSWLNEVELKEARQKQVETVSAALELMLSQEPRLMTF